MPAPSERGEGPAANAPALALAAVGAALLVLHATRHPLANLALPEARHLSAPSLPRLALALRTGAALAALNVAALSVGLRGLVSMRREVDLLDGLALGFVALGTAVLGLAAAHLLSPAASVALLLCALAVLPWRALAAARGAAPGRGVLACVALFTPPLLLALVPTHGWDGLTYHLAVPEWYLRTGRVVVTPYSIPSAYPHLTEMLYALGLAMQGPETARALHVEFGLLAVLAAGSLAARWSGPRASWVAVLLLVAEPAFRRVSEMAYTDLSAVFFSILAVRALEASARSGARGVWLAGLFAGSAFATRYNGALVVAAVGVEALRRAWRVPGEERSPLRFAAGALLVCAPWCVRNAALTGAPLSPIAQGWLTLRRAPFFDPTVLAQQQAFLDDIGMGRGPVDLLLLPWNVAMRSVEGRYAQSFGWSFGLLSLVGVAAVALAWRRLPDGARGAARVVALLTLGFFVTLQEGRYLLPPLALLAALTAAAVDRLTATAPRATRALALAPLVGAALWSVGPEALRIPWRWHVALGGGHPERVEGGDPCARTAVTLRRRIAPGERAVLVFEPRSYLFRGIDHDPYHLNEGSLVLREVSRAPSAGALAAAWHARGVRWVVVRTGSHDVFHPSFVAGYTPAQWRRDKARVDELLARHAEVVAEDPPYVLARLAPGR